jgi:hypothetical protein
MQIHPRSEIGIASWQMRNDRFRRVSRDAPAPRRTSLDRTGSGHSAREPRTGPNAPNRSSGKTRGASGKPVLNGSTICALETCQPIDTAPPVGEKMLLPHD